MKFLKNQSGRLRFKGSNLQDDESIGSALSEKDQFYIAIKVKQRSSWISRSDSTVSSITSPGRHSPPFSRVYSFDSDESKQSWCCCSGATEATAQSDNTLLHGSHNSDNIKEETPTPKHESLWGCCGTSDDPQSCSIDRPDRTQSLFDTTIADEGGEPRHKRMKRWKSSVRRAMIWKRRGIQDAPRVATISTPPATKEQ